MSNGCSRTFGNPVFSSQQQLESMYPDIYYVVYPEVVRQCNMLDHAYGAGYTPDREQMEPLVEDIYNNVNEKLKGKEEKDSEKLQFGRGGFLNDLVWIIFLNELIGRRRRRFPGYRRPFPPYRPYGRFSPFGPFGY